jgi:hypothetical protein
MASPHVALVRGVVYGYASVSIQRFTDFHPMNKKSCASLAAIILFSRLLLAQYPEWTHHGSLFLNTTPEAALKTPPIEGFRVATLTGFEPVLLP